MFRLAAVTKPLIIATAIFLGGKEIVHLAIPISGVPSGVLFGIAQNCPN
jgi:hypothetical protein